MTDKTEDQVMRDKAAVEAMRHAKANMTQVLDRIDALERALRMATERMRNLKPNIPANAYPYKGEVSIHAQIDGYIADALKALG